MPNGPMPPAEPLVMARFQILKVLDHGPCSFLYLAQDPARKSLLLMAAGLLVTTWGALADVLERRRINMKAAIERLARKG